MMSVLYVNFLSLEKRRLLAYVTFLYKALHGIIDIDVEPYVDFYKETGCYSFIHNDKLTLKMRYTRTNVLTPVNIVIFIQKLEHGTPFPFPFVRQRV